MNQGPEEEELNTLPVSFILLIVSYVPPSFPCLFPALLLFYFNSLFLRKASKTTKISNAAIKDAACFVPLPLQRGFCSGGVTWTLKPAVQRRCCKLNFLVRREILSIIHTPFGECERRTYVHEPMVSEAPPGKNKALVDG